MIFDVVGNAADVSGRLGKVCKTMGAAVFIVDDETS